MVTEHDHGLTSLPSEILTMVMCNLSSLRDLTNLAHSSKLFFDILRREERAIIPSVLKNLVEYKYFLLISIVVDIDQNCGEEIDYSCNPNEYWARNLSAAYEAEVRSLRGFATSSWDLQLQMVTLHELTERFSQRYLETIIKRIEKSRNPFHSPPQSLSGSESIRIHRALIHFELMCRFFPPTRAASDASRCRGNLKDFLGRLPAWQQDEVHSVVCYLESLWGGIVNHFVADARAILRLVERTQGADITNQGKPYNEHFKYTVQEQDIDGLYHAAGLKSDIFPPKRSLPEVITYFVARGIVFLYNLLNLKSWEEQQDFILRWWPADCPSEHNLKDIIVSSRAAGLKRHSHLIFHELDCTAWSECSPNDGEHLCFEDADRTSDDPSSANAWWKWIDANVDVEDEPWLYYEELSRTGLWLWDAARLTRWGVFDPDGRGIFFFHATDISGLTSWLIHNRKDFVVDVPINNDLPLYKYRAGLATS